MLRLNKSPFQMQASFDPLDAGDLDVLRAFELLESRSGMLETLIRLAQPGASRRDAGRALGPMKLLSATPGPRDTLMIFAAAPGARDAEISPGAFGLVLSDGEPEHVLEPRLWPRLACGDCAILARRRAEPDPDRGSSGRLHRARLSVAHDPVGAGRLVARPDLRRPQRPQGGRLPGLPCRKGRRVSVKDDVLAFLRDPQAFAAGAADPAIWLEGLDEFALPSITAQADRALRAAQEAAWRGLADRRAGLVLGPPGTGKTHLLSWLIAGYGVARSRAAAPARTFVTAFTKNAAANVLEAVAKRHAQHAPDAPSPIYYGAPRTLAWRPG